MRLCWGRKFWADVMVATRHKINVVATWLTVSAANWLVGFIVGVLVALSLSGCAMHVGGSVTRPASPHEPTLPATDPEPASRSYIAPPIEEASDDDTVR